MKARLFAFVALLLLPAPSLWAQGLLPDIQAARSAFPTPIGAENAAKLLNLVAWNHRNEGWGLLRKGAGNSCPLAQTFISCDILIHAPSIRHYDVLTDSEGAATPGWRDAGPCILSDTSGCEMSKFLAPIDPAVLGGGPTNPTNPTNPTTGTVLTYEAAVKLLDELVVRIADGRRVAEVYDQNERMFADEQEKWKANMLALQGIREDINQPGWWKELRNNRIFQMGVAGLSVWVEEFLRRR